MKFNKLYLISILIAQGFSGFSQNIKEDLKTANIAISNTKEICMDIVYNFYCSQKQTMATDSKTSMLSKKGDVYYMLNGQTEVISINNIQLSINNKEKVVVISKLKNMPLSDITKNIDGLIKSCKKTDFKTVGAEKVYLLSINDYGIEKIEIRIQKNSSLMSKIIFYQKKYN